MIIINDGGGKGKTTAAIGAAVRAAGHGLKVKFIQMIKNANSGELTMMRKIGIDVEQCGIGFTKNGETSQHEMAAQAGLDTIRNAILSYDMVICDEINYALKGGLIKESAIFNLMELADERGVHLILTGRGATPLMINKADIVTEMTKIKHAYDSGVKAQAGIEF